MEMETGMATATATEIRTRITMDICRSTSMRWCELFGERLLKSMTYESTRCCYCEQGAFPRLRAASFSAVHARPAFWTGRSPGFEVPVGGNLIISDLTKPSIAPGSSGGET